MADGTEPVGSFQTDAVVPRGINAATCDANVLARIDIHAVAVGVEFEIVNGEVVDACRENREPATVENREITEDDVVAIAQGDGLVAAAFGIAVVTLLALGLVGETVEAVVEAFAVNQAGAENRNVLQADAPDQAVLPMAVPEVLVMKLVAPVVGLGWIEGRDLLAGRLDG